MAQVGTVPWPDVSRRALARFFPATIIVAVVGALFAQTRHVGLLGFDAYPIIAASRVQSLGDLLGTFTENLMDGRYPSEFYRPLVNLTFAWDHAVWGLDPFGYQLTNALLLAGCAWALWALLQRLLGPGGWLGAGVGLLVFLLSPLQFEVLPAAPRRAELMCCALMALALAWQLSPRLLRAPRQTAWPALATLLAIASKETGFVVPLLVLAAVCLYSERDTPAGRARHALAATVPHLAVAGLMFGLRLALLGGIGGHQSVTATGVAAVTPTALESDGAWLTLSRPTLCAGNSQEPPMMQ